MGEPLRLMVDLPNECEIVDILVHQPGMRLIVASDAGNGFIVPENDVIAQTRSGKQVLNVGDGVAKTCIRMNGDHVAVASENAKLIVFATDELPEMGRGKGVRLQKYKKAAGRQGTLEIDGGLCDLTTFQWADGLSWQMGGGKTRTEPDMSEWKAARGGVGKRPPYGFPKTNKFS